ncbi:MAG: hypothetical protein E7K04_03690 [Helicobacter sp.]|nr:hypothetical protein [Helicobacter sp.]
MPLNNAFLQWSDELKVALLRRDVDGSFELTQEFLHNFADNSLGSLNIDELNIAKDLISQVIDLLKDAKNTTKDELLNIKNAKKFIS